MPDKDPNFHPDRHADREAHPNQNTHPPTTNKHTYRNLHAATYRHADSDPYLYTYFDRHGNCHFYAMSATERNRLGLWFSRVWYRLGLVLRMLRG